MKNRTQNQRATLVANVELQNSLKVTRKADKPAKGAMQPDSVSGFDYKTVNRDASLQLKEAFYRLDTCIDICKKEYREGTAWRTQCNHLGIAVDFICESILKDFAPQMFFTWVRCEEAGAEKTATIFDKDGNSRVVYSKRVERVLFRIETVKSGILAARRAQKALKKAKEAQRKAAKKADERAEAVAIKMAKLEAELVALKAS